MRVLCRHGHYAFYPRDREEIVRFVKLFSYPLVGENDYFTFEALAGLPRYSLVGVAYGGLVATATYEGRGVPEVLAANGFVYSVGLGILIPLDAVVQTVALKQTLNAALAPKPFVQAGAVLDDGAGTLVGYSGELDLDFQKLYIYERELLNE